MRIGIDARIFGAKETGIGRYTQELIKQLEVIETNNEYSIFLRHSGYQEYTPHNPGFRKVLADFRPYTLQEQIRFYRLLRRHKPDIMHFPHWNVPYLYKHPFIVTIHDLILDALPELQRESSTRSWTIRKLKLFCYKKSMKKTLQKAQTVIAISPYTKRDLIKYYHVEKEKIHVLSNGFTPLAESRQTETQRNNDKETFSRYNIGKPFLLSVGSAYPHKNLKRALRVFRTLPKNLSYVLVCKQDAFLTQLKHWCAKNGLSERIRFIENVPDSDLAVLYRNAELYLCPSLYEGFGMPPLEAMHFGTPVASSNAASLPQIYKDAALYFNPYDEREMKRVILSILNNDHLRRKITANGNSLIQQSSCTKPLPTKQHSYLKN